LSADDLTSEMLTELSVIAASVVTEKRLTFPRTNIFTEVLRERSIEPVRFSARPDGHAGMAIAVAVADEPSPAVTVSEPGPGLSSIIEVRTRTRGRRQQP
jgi:hypothetical protein